jgi:hypothetical protein
MVIVFSCPKKRIYLPVGTEAPTTHPGHPPDPPVFMARFLMHSLIGCSGKPERPSFRALPGVQGREDYGIFRFATDM